MKKTTCGVIVAFFILGAANGRCMKEGDIDTNNQLTNNQLTNNQLQKEIQSQDGKKEDFSGNEKFSKNEEFLKILTSLSLLIPAASDILGPLHGQLRDAIILYLGYDIYNLSGETWKLPFDYEISNFQIISRCLQTVFFYSTAQHLLYLKKKSVKKDNPGLFSIILNGSKNMLFSFAGSRVIEELFKNIPLVHYPLQFACFLFFERKMRDLGKDFSPWIMKVLTTIARAWNETKYHVLVNRLKESEKKVDPREELKEETEDLRHHLAKSDFLKQTDTQKKSKERGHLEESPL